MAASGQFQRVELSVPKKNWGRIFIYLVLIVGAIVSVIPFIYMFLTSLKSYGDVINNNFWPWFPFGNQTLQWSNYPEAIYEIGMDRIWGIPLVARYFFNSLIVTALIVSGTVLTSIMAAYAFAFINIPGKNVLFVLVLATLMIPNDLTLVPKVVMMFNWSWYNSYAALTVPFMVSVFGLFLLRQFFLQIPKELFDAALIDGAGHIRYLFTIVVPLAKPAIITVSLLNFIWAWDSFKWPLLVTRDANMRVVAVGLQQFLSEGGSQTQLLMAFASLVIIPVLVFYFFTQKFFTEGIARTGIKG